MISTKQGNRSHADIYNPQCKETHNQVISSQKLLSGARRSSSDSDLISSADLLTNYQEISKTLWVRFPAAYIYIHERTIDLRCSHQWWRQRHDDSSALMFPWLAEIFTQLQSFYVLNEPNVPWILVNVPRSIRLMRSCTNSTIQSSRVRMGCRDAIIDSDLTFICPISYQFIYEEIFKM